MNPQSRLMAIRLAFALVAALTFASFGALDLTGAEDNQEAPKQETFKSKCDKAGGSVSTQIEGGATWSYCKGTKDGNDFKCDTTNSEGGKKCQYTLTRPPKSRFGDIRVPIDGGIVLEPQSGGSDRTFEVEATSATFSTLEPLP